MISITVYTPTYNRGYCITRLYDSLKSQTNKNFRWLIVDDGSSDDTETLVNKWIDENKIEIQYKYQQNKGKQEAVNLAHSLINTTLNVCVDSDDYLVEDAISKILRIWELNQSESLAGLVGLDAFENGKIVGTKFPVGVNAATFSEFESRYHVKGDKKFVYRTDVINKYPPYPSIKNEKFPAPGYLYRLIDQDYSLLLVNEILCVVEYLPDGISRNKFTQLKNSPNSFAFYRLERIRLDRNVKDKLKNAIHYISCCLFAGNISTTIFNKYWFYTIPMFPFGIALYLYIRFSNKKSMMK